MQPMVKRDVDDLRTWRLAVEAHRQETSEIGDVETQDEISRADLLDDLWQGLCRATREKRMIGREARTEPRIGQHRRFEVLCQGDPGEPGFLLARAATGKD